MLGPTLPTCEGEIMDDEVKNNILQLKRNSAIVQFPVEFLKVILDANAIDNDVGFCS